MTDPKIHVAAAGLGFGAESIPLWQKHPHARCYAICQRNEDKHNAVDLAKRTGLKYMTL